MTILGIDISRQSNLLYSTVLEGMMLYCLKYLCTAAQYNSNIIRRRQGGVEEFNEHSIHSIFFEHLHSLLRSY